MIQSPGLFRALLSVGVLVGCDVKQSAAPPSDVQGRVAAHLMLTSGSLDWIEADVAVTASSTRRGETRQSTRHFQLQRRRRSDGSWATTALPGLTSQGGLPTPRAEVVSLTHTLGDDDFEVRYNDGALMRYSSMKTAEQPPSRPSNFLAVDALPRPSSRGPASRSSVPPGIVLRGDNLAVEARLRALRQGLNHQPSRAKDGSLLYLTTRGDTTVTVGVDEQLGFPTTFSLAVGGKQLLSGSWAYQEIAPGLLMTTSRSARFVDGRRGTVTEMTTTMTGVRVGSSPTP